MHANEDAIRQLVANCLDAARRRYRQGVRSPMTVREANLLAPAGQ